MASVVYSNDEVAGSILGNAFERLHRLNQVWKVEDFSLFLMYWSLETLSYIRNTDGVHRDLLFL